MNQVDTDKLIQGLIAEKEKLLRELENSRKTGTMGYTDAGEKWATKWVTKWVTK